MEACHINSLRAQKIPIPLTLWISRCGLRTEMWHLNPVSYTFVRMGSSRRKTALVTGASRGIGFEIARELAARGFAVILTARNPDDGRRMVEQLRKVNPGVAFVRLDVSDIRSIRQAFAAAKKHTDRLEVLVNNAGVLLDESTGLLDVSPEVVYETLHTNALSALFVTQVFLPFLGSGSRVINVSSGGGSITGGTVGDWAPVYCISKTTMNAITLHLARALKGKKIAVNAVCPGWVKTRMGGRGAPRSVAEGADTAVWLATEAPGDLTGKLLKDRKEIAW